MLGVFEGGCGEVGRRMKREEEGRNGRINIPPVMRNTLIFKAMRCVISHHTMGHITQIVTAEWDQDCRGLRGGCANSQL